MRILAIDTSCDETAAAVTQDTNVLSNIIWSQASLHAKFGGILPSLAQRMHQERIGWVINKALVTSHQSLVTDIDAIAVTVGPGLGIALCVGIDKAKELAKKINKPLIPVNHVEGHLLGCFAKPRNSKSETLNSKQIQNSKIKFPSFGLVLSGGTTLLTLINKIGKYKILAETVDDALGEALDKAARILGLGYPGGPILEKIARNGNPFAYPLPLPLKDDRIKNRFSYSGLKTAFVRLVESIKDPTKEQICNLAASFQEVAFDHIINVLSFQITSHKSPVTSHFLLGGGVACNITLRKKIRSLCKEKGLKLHLPYSKKLLTDNAGMVGVCGYLRTKNEELKTFTNYSQIDQNPRLKITTSL